MTLVLLAALLFQDVGRLLDDLASDDLEAREKAADALVALGDAAEPELKKRRADLTGELKVRVDDVLARIARARENGKVLPLFKPVSIDVKDAPLSEAIAAAGFKIDGVPDLRVTLKADNVSPIEALDRLCDAAGAGWTSHDTAITVVKGASPPAPRAYGRHYRVDATSVTVTRTNGFGADHASSRLDMRLSWPPNVKPEALVAFSLTSVVDDTGRELVIDPKSAAPERLEPGLTASRAFALKHPAGRAEKLATVKGAVKLRFPADVQSVRFAPPQQGDVREAGGLRFELTDCGVETNSFNVGIKITGKFARRLAADDADTPKESWGIALPFEKDAFVFTTEDGSPLRSRGGGSGSSTSHRSFSWRFAAPGSPLKSIEVSYPCDAIYDAFEFEIKDVALPKKPE